ncbi:hypothetical protein AG1IA_08126 [Rhizoctonia solani AG-1 IA]|uniref:Uncharacterized protein n=1 Tax=Thanatephorus cucumeris (strain AG1-IA) TaxID=983506 RepID=L8WND1_THACA|nr:hypothetical protein AG1IA_08126 [Rhizoctonia solani AG-1 IA]
MDAANGKRFIHKVDELKSEAEVDGLASCSSWMLINKLPGTSCISYIHIEYRRNCKLAYGGLGKKPRQGQQINQQGTIIVGK